MRKELDLITQEPIREHQCPKCESWYLRMSIDDEEEKCPRCVNERMLDD